MKITQDQVLEFARWTGDCNPIHVDPVAAKESAFGGNICHGMLVLIESLSNWELELKRFPAPLACVDVQFRSEVRPGTVSHLHFARNDAGFSGKVTSEDSLQMEVVARWNETTSKAISSDRYDPAFSWPAFSWMNSAKSTGIVTSIDEQPVPWTIEDFYPGQEILGVHRFARHHSSADSKFSLVQEQVFGLCSFIVGMRVPGLSSLFTKLKAEFVAEPPATEELLYRLTLRSYDENFRILEMQLDVATGALQPVATCCIECYVRFPKLEPHLATYDGDVAEVDKQSMSGKVALICGASRGLGAEIAAALACVDGTVYLASRTRSQTSDQLVEQIEQRGGQVHVLLGDVGDPKWCEQTAKRLEKTHGRLDHLVLNACELPLLKTIAKSNPTESANYIQRNVGLFQQPLMHFLELLKSAGGTLVAISSSAVEEIPAGFGDYVAVKLALEGSVRTLAKENPSIRCLIVRPPQLQTAWNDTPIRAVGSVSVSAVASEILSAVCKSTWEKNLQWVTKFAKRKRVKKTPESIAELPLVSSFTLDPIHPAFEGWSQVLERGIQPRVAPYAQVLQQALDPGSISSKSPVGSVYLIRCEDWFHELPAEILDSSERVSEVLEKNVVELVEAIKTHRTMAKGPTLFLLCPSFVESANAQLFADAETELESALSHVAGLTFWKADSFHERYGITDLTFQDALRNTIGHIPYTDPYYDFLATLCVRHLQRRLEPPKKVIVLDCDNTLWRGVVGELGSDGIGFDPVHHRLHRLLVNLAQNGMLLCLCSKNEPEDVWAVFDQRKDFGLAREHIVAAKINWMPKGQNIQELAHALNLGLDSFVFLDDNPVECAEVRANCPTVLTLQWYQDSKLANQLLDHLWELDIHATTKEDRERTRMYREEFQRQEVQSSAANFQAFIDSLQLAVEFTEVTDEYVARASQLTLRTNQFNFTTVRRNESEILELSRNPDIDMRIVQVRDRFGDYGVVGLFITKSDASVFVVDTFLLSCRVLGRGVEHRIASHIASLAQSRGYSSVRWIYRPTEKNAPARLFLQSIANQGELVAKPTEILVPVDSLQALKFQAEQAADPVEEAVSKESKPANSGTVSIKRSTRVREEHIRRSVEELANWKDISKSFRGGSDSIATGRVSDLDVESHVLETFSKVLGVETEKVKSVDRLDALGCDSLQIVGITVSLTKVFPNLPPTLLFEYRSVSEIVEQIAQLCKPSEAAMVAQRSSASNELGHSDARLNRLDDAVAIVGIGIRCAAGDDTRSLWKALVGRETMVNPLPKERDGFVGQMEYQQPYYASLISDVTGFDPEFFGISPREAQYMDPQMRMVLETSWHALEDSGSWRENLDRSMGVFVGVMYQCYGRLANVIATQNVSVYRCWEGFGVANRLSQILGVSGPSLAIDTACSSSATALHYAVQSLKNNDCSSALVSGVNLILDPARIAQLDNLGILTRSGKCVPFGDQADGTVIGEGAVSVVIKRLSEAVANSDRIYAVIKGTGLSVGAGSVGFTAPNPVAQSVAIRAALADAHVDPRTIGYVETHGTGTQLGDPIEVRGLEMAYCDPSLWDHDLQCQAHTGIGSIKPNIGHLEAGAGLVGVVKAALQLHHKTLLPSITSEKPNPQIPFDKLPFKIQRTAEDWAPLKVFRKSSQATEILPRRAAVNSFGVGGSNAHIVLEEAPQNQANQNQAPSSGIERSSHLLILQAPDPKSLQLQAARWSGFLREQTDRSIGDAVYSNVDGHKDFEYRAAVLIDDLASAASQLDRWSSANLEWSAASAEDQGVLWGNALWKKSNRIAYLFTGQGAQYPGMLGQLYQENPVFKHAIDECSEHVDPLLQNSIRRILFDQNPEATLIHQTRFTQPSMFVVQYGLFKLWESYGVKPDVLVGHSIGEIAAYCVAGGCSLADGLRLVSTRGELMQRLEAGGGMTSVAASAETVEALIGNSGVDLSIAAYNGPNQTVVSGSLEQLSRFADLATSAGIKTQPLKVSHAFHSKLMDPMLDEFRSVVSKLALGVPGFEFISTVTGKKVHQELASPEYWVGQVRQPVRFMQAMETLSSSTISHCIEIGPHPVLVTMARSMELSNTSDTTRWLPSARRGFGDWSVFLPSVGQLVADGYRIDWRSAERPYLRRRVSVPGFEFSNRRIWLDELDTLGSSEGALPSAMDPAACEQSIGRLTYTVRWQQSSVLDDARRSNPTVRGHGLRWLILALGQSGFIQEFQAQLSAKHGSVHVIHWDQTVDAWGAGSDNLGEFDRVLLVVGDSIEDHTAGWSAEEVQQACEMRINAFSQALERTKFLIPKESERVFWVVTHGAQIVDGEPVLAPWVSPLWGGARVASIEWPEVWGGIIDIQDGIDDCILLIEAPTEEDQLILRSGKAWVPRLERIDLSSIGNLAVPAAQVKLGSSVLITGGMGAIGLRLAEYAVEQGCQEIILVSRNTDLNEIQRRRIKSLNDIGAEVKLVSADVSSQEGIERLSASLAGKTIDSIIHAAGVDFLAPIGQWTVRDVERVTRVKIRGTWNLHQWSLGQPIRCFLMTSSIASIWGAPDRFLYASANAFLDSFAQWRIAQGLPATAFNFGPWAQGGMADSASLEGYARLGMYGLVPDEAIAAIDQAVMMRRSGVVITDTNWDRFVPVMTARRSKPFFERLARDSREPGPVSEGVSSDPAWNPQERQSEPRWIGELRSIAPGNRLSELRQRVCRELSQVLKSQEDRLVFDRNLYRLGLDSITAVEFSMRIRRATGVAPGQWMTGEPTLDSISSNLLSSLDRSLERNSQELPSTSSKGPAAVLSGTWGIELSKLSSVEDKTRHLVELLGHDLQRFTGKTKISLGVESRISDLGLDSLGMVDFATHLRVRLGLRSTPRLMQYATVGDWIASIIPMSDNSDTASSETAVSGESRSLGAQEFEIISYEPSMHSGVMEFCRKGWPERSRDAIEARWNWMFLGSASRLGAIPRVWVARNRTGVIGHMGSQLTRLKVGDREVTAAWFVDTMVLESYRQQGIGAQIMLEAEEQMPLALSLGQTAEIRKILDSLGWKQICPLNIYVFMNKPGNVLRGKLPFGADRLAATYMSLGSARRRALEQSRSSDMEVRPLRGFGPSHDKLWLQMGQTVSCLAVRDSSYLNWKAVQQPGMRYDCWEIRSKSDLIGVLVTRTEEPTEHYNYRRFHVIDIVCSVTSEAIDKMISACIAKSMESNSDAISFSVTNRIVESRLIANGFVARPATRYLYASRGLIAACPNITFGPWFINQSDSDIDRPS